jgi:hypothetical protein
MIKEHLRQFDQTQDQAKKGSMLKDEHIKLTNVGYIYKTLADNSYTLSTEILNKQHYVLQAEAHFCKVIMTKGWDKLSISTYKGAGPYLQAYFAGYLEGRLTAGDIWDFYYNLKQNHEAANNANFQKLINFFENVSKHLDDRISRLNTLTDIKEMKYWSQIVLGYSQLEGLHRGYTYEITRLNRYEEMKMSLADFLILQADGEIPELLRYLGSLDKDAKVGEKGYFAKAFGIQTENPVEFWKRLMWTSKCSAFMKITKDANGNWVDLFTGHTTWTEYYEMLRTYKHYKFELEDNIDSADPKHNDKAFRRSEIQFSSYPGAISSTDDFYITDQKLMITETTLEVIDINLYKKYVKKEQEYIPNFMRVLAATRAARSAEEWVKHFSYKHSGTYCSQWMIVDYNIFEKIKGTKDRPNGLFYIMEDNPQEIESHDISKYFYDFQFFGSYNRAFLDGTKEILETKKLEKIYGDFLGYNGANRGKEFNALQGDVTDLKSFNHVLRYNGYKASNFPADPSSANAGSAIAARFDIGGSNLSGGVDTKVTNLEFIKKLASVAISGPTTENPNLPPFSWKNTKSTESRRGVPEVFNFPYIYMSPATISGNDPNDVYQF